MIVSHLKIWTYGQEENSFKQKAINRINRRINTLERKGINVKFHGETEIRNVLDANFAYVDENNINEIVNTMVKGSEAISRENAKRVKKEMGFSKISDVQRLSNNELASVIAALYNSGLLDERKEVLEAYGYEA